jgi:UTP--glucose-1-phosphate uridylyltransferase
MGGVYGVVFRGRRYDTGDRLDYLKSIVRIAADREDLGPDFRHWLIEYASTLPEQIPAGEEIVPPTTGTIPVIHNA